MLVQSTNVWLNEQLQPAIIEMNSGLITNLYEYNAKPVDIDFEDFYILPGFIDSHDHGYNSNDANRATRDFMNEWSTYLLSEGITTFLPTTSTVEEDILIESLKIINGAKKHQTSGAKIHGIHSEGIYLSYEKRGAHNPDLLQKPNVKQFMKWQEAAGGNIKILSLAPEVDIDHELIKYASRNGVVVSLAHSNATFKEATEAIRNGAKSFTHLFNAMTGLHHREPGMVGAALSNEEVFAELICDGLHVDFNVAKIAAICKGKDRLIAVTDAIKLKGLGIGVYTDTDTSEKITINADGSVTLEDSTLAGSINKLNNMVHNIVYKMKQPLPLAINAVTINPARLLGIDNEVGLIKAGYKADFTVTDKDFQIQNTFVNGQLAYSNN